MYLAIALCAVSLVIAAVTPRFEEDNPNCSDLGYSGSELRIEGTPPTPGNYSIDGGQFVWTTSDGVYFDWNATIGIDAVVCKGGPLGVNAYDYDPASYGDTGLYCPDSASGGPAEISHILVCLDGDFEIPEFTAIGAGIALLGAGVYIWKKRK